MSEIQSENHRKTDIKSMDLAELKAFMTSIGEKPFRASQIYQWMHVRHVSSWDEMTNLSKALREKLKEQAELKVLEPVTIQISKLDGTKKYLFRLPDGNMIESVLMRYKHGNSVCISSQAGCRMGCRFCASTLDGLVRGLTPAEMLEQIYRVGEDIGERISNVVVMGTGEPLALSLHASNQKKRQELMPIANKYDIEEVIDACKYYFSKTGRRVTFEYSLVAGVNDTKEDAEELSRLIHGMNCHVNLIPVNPIKERDYKQPDHTATEKFKIELEKNAINVTIRREMGRDIDGACGQLRKRYTEG